MSNVCQLICSSILMGSLRQIELMSETSSEVDYWSLCLGSFLTEPDFCHSVND